MVGIRQNGATFSQIQSVITGDLASNRDRIMRLYADRTRFMHFVQYLIAAERKQLVMSYQASLSGLLSPMSVKYYDHRLNHSPEIRPGAVGGGISNFYKCRLEVALSATIWPKFQCKVVPPSQFKHPFGGLGWT